MSAGRPSFSANSIRPIAMAETVHGSADDQLADIARSASSGSFPKSASSAGNMAKPELGGGGRGHQRGREPPALGPEVAHVGVRPDAGERVRHGQRRRSAQGRSG